MTTGAGTPPGSSAGIVYLLDDEAAVLDAIAFMLTSRGLDVRPHATGPGLLATVDATPRPLPACFCSTFAWSPCRACASSTS